MARDRHNAVDAELDGLLHDKVHLVGLQEADGQDEPDRRLRIRIEALHELHRHRVGRKSGHLHARDLVLIVDDDDLLPRLCPHDVHEVMRIRTADLDGIREDTLVEESSHFASSRLMTIAAQPFSSMTLSMAKPCASAASVTSATRSSMMPEANR